MKSGTRPHNSRPLPGDPVRRGPGTSGFAPAGLVPGLLVLGVLALGFLASGCGSVRSGGPPDILLVTLDTTRADYLGCYGRDAAETPTLDRLAAEGTLYEQCISPVPITLPAHASILTGLNPDAHGVRDNGTYTLGPDPEILAEILSARGYDTAAFVSAYVLDDRYGLDRGFDHYDDTVRTSDATIIIEERIAEETATAAIQWLGEKRNRPWFLWVHFFDPHLKYSPPGEWGERFAEDPYAGEIAYMDHELGRLLEAVDLDSTLVIAVGDHGEALGDHGEETHAFFVYDSTLLVPLIVREPGARRRGVHENAQVSIVDVFPTILEAAGAPIPDGIDGTELSRAVREADRFVYFESTFPFVFGWSPLIGLRSREWKYIHAPRPELYRVSADPGETENVLERHTELAEDLADQLAILGPLENLRAGASAFGLTPEEREALGALGYLGGALPEKSAEFESLPDPKDNYPVYRNVMQAQAAYVEGEDEAAERLLQTVLREHPHLPPAHLLLGRVLTARGNPREAVEHLEHAVAACPGDPSAWYALAAAANSAGQTELALETCRRGLERFPDEAALYEQLGVAHRIAGASAEAIAAGRRSVELVPSRAAALANLGASLAAAGELDEAVVTLERALELDPGSPDVLRGLASALFKAGECRKAEARLRDLLHILPGDYQAMLDLAQTLLCQQRSEEAVAVSHRLLEMRPGEWVPTYLLCHAHVQLAEYEVAESILRNFLREHPGFGPVYQSLCQVLVLQGLPKLDEARSLAREALENGVRMPKPLLDQLNL